MKCTGIVHYKDGVILSAIAINYCGKTINLPVNTQLIFLLKAGYVKARFVSIFA